MGPSRASRQTRRDRRAGAAVTAAAPAFLCFTPSVPERTTSESARQQYFVLLRSRHETHRDRAVPLQRRERPRVRRAPRHAAHCPPSPRAVRLRRTAVVARVTVTAASPPSRPRRFKSRVGFFVVIRVGKVPGPVRHSLAVPSAEAVASSSSQGSRTREGHPVLVPGEDARRRRRAPQVPGARRAVVAGIAKSPAGRTRRPRNRTPRVGTPGDWKSRARRALCACRIYARRPRPL